MTPDDSTQPEKLCFGRSAEQDEFIRWVENEPAEGDIGRAALLIGPAGMGKTTLLWKLAGLCRARGPESWYVQLETLNANESPSSFLARLMENTHRLLQGKYLREGPDDKKILKGLLKATPAVGELLTVLVSDEKRPGWQRFIDYVGGVSEALARTNDRFVLLIDPDRAMQEGQADEWLSIAKLLPARVRVLIAQRPDDVVAAHAEAKLRFAMVPSSGSLPELGEESVKSLYEHEFKYGRLEGAVGGWPADIRDTLPAEAWKRYQGHPFAHDALIRLLISRAATDPIREMTEWPPTLEALLDMLLESLSKQGEKREKAALALQVFAIPTPLAMWAKAAGVTDATLSHALRDPCYAHFFTEVEKDVFTPFHALFAERLEQELQRLSDTRHILAEAAWRGLEPDLDPETLATTIPSQFTLLAATQVASRLDTTMRLLEAVDLVGEVKRRLGMLDEYEADQRLVLDRHGHDEEVRATVYGKLGTLHHSRGNLETGEEMLNKALEVSQRLEDIEGMARVFGNLGNLYLTRGELDASEHLYRKALEANWNLGRLEGMAIQYGNLGVLHQTRGELLVAEQMYSQALELDEKLERLEGKAIQYGNLGNVYEIRGDLSSAEEMYGKALEVNQKLGRRKGVATHYGCLGNLSLMRGAFSAAEQMYSKAIKIHEELGHLEGMAIDCGNLGSVYLSRDDLEAAEQMYNKALGIAEKLGLREGMASVYCNLGDVHKTRGDLDDARESWTKSRDLYQQIGMPHMVKQLQGWLDGLDEKQRGQG